MRSFITAAYSASDKVVSGDDAIATVLSLEKEWGKSFRVCHCPAASKRLTAQDQTNRNASAATANSFMLDFRCVIIPRFAFATSHAFHAERIRDKKITQRIKQVADELVRFTKALRS